MIYLGRTKVNFARSRADRRLIKKDMSSAGQNEGRPIWVDWRLREYSARGAIKTADELNKKLRIRGFKHRS